MGGLVWVSACSSMVTYLPALLGFILMCTDALWFKGLCVGWNRKYNISFVENDIDMWSDTFAQSCWRNVIKFIVKSLLLLYLKAGGSDSQQCHFKFNTMGSSVVIFERLKDVSLRCRRLTRVLQAKQLNTNKTQRSPRLCPLLWPGSLLCIQGNHWAVWTEHTGVRHLALGWMAKVQQSNMSDTVRTTSQQGGTSEGHSTDYVWVNTALTG